MTTLPTASVAIGYQRCKMPIPTLQNAHIAIIGLGYVGLPLAVAFSKAYPTIGFDIDKSRIDELKSSFDSTQQVGSQDLQNCTNLSFTHNLSHIAHANIYIICVPTPITENKTPNLSALLHASELVGKVLQKGNIVIYESTTYPTCTENECKNALEQSSGLCFNIDFYLGYSPERINPSDSSHTLTQIQKITSGSTQKVAAFIDSLYGSIITAGTFCVSSIKTAEMTKIIENAQRDLNIAFINEMYMICDVLQIDALEVLEAAKTKWNFLPFTPGLVGGHCISVDPYYLTHKLNSIGYHPQVISSGRLINDTMPMRFILDSGLYSQPVSVGDYKLMCDLLLPFSPEDKLKNYLYEDYYNTYPLTTSGKIPEMEEHGRISTSLDDSVFLILSSGMKFNNQHLTGVGMYKLPDYFLKEEIYNGYLTNHFIRRFGNMYIDSKNQRVVLFDSPQDSTSLLVTDLQEVVQKLKQGIYEYRTKKNNSLLQRVFRK